MNTLHGKQAELRVDGHSGDMKPMVRGSRGESWRGQVLPRLRPQTEMGRLLRARQGCTHTEESDSYAYYHLGRQLQNVTQ